MMKPKKNKCLQYEQEKKAIAALNLPPDEYEKLIMKLCRKLKI